MVKVYTDDGWLTHKVHGLWLLEWLSGLYASFWAEGKIFFQPKCSRPVYRVPTCCGVLPVETVEHDAAMYGLGFGL